MCYRRRVIALLTLLLCTACYHATIETEATPSTVTIDKTFAASWIFGLVPPKTVSTASQCTHGTAKVETKLSFLNQLVGFITFGIYTPMNIRVTCAQGPNALAPAPRPDVLIREGATQEEIIEAFQTAADRAVQLERPVRVHFHGVSG